jgi:hypothetical protein
VEKDLGEGGREWDEVVWVDMCRRGEDHGVTIGWRWIQHTFSDYVGCMSMRRTVN